MFTNALLAFSLLAAAVLPPDVSKMPVLGKSGGICPDGAVIEFTDYDSNPGDDESSIRVFTYLNMPLAAVIFKTKEVYIYGEQKMYPLDEMKDKYPSPCDLPRPQGA